MITRTQKTVTWAALLAIAGLLVWVSVMTVRPARSETEQGPSKEHWKIVVTLHQKDTGQTAQLVYGNQQTGPVYFDSEAACKKEIADPKSTFNMESGAKIKAYIKKSGDTVEPFACRLDIPAHMKDSI